MPAHLDQDAVTADTLLLVEVDELVSLVDGLL
jgi:hypothetical protein